jgi:hypothetical protein
MHLFDNVKRLKDRITMTCRVYDNRYCKVLTIACRDIQSEDGAIQIFFWKNLKFVMSKKKWCTKRKFQKSYG